MGGSLPDFVGSSGYPSIAVLSINPRIDAMGQNRTQAQGIRLDPEMRRQWQQPPQVLRQPVVLVRGFGHVAA
jgi:hypothetical protein